MRELNMLDTYWVHRGYIMELVRTCDTVINYWSVSSISVPLSDFVPRDRTCMLTLTADLFLLKEKDLFICNYFGRIVWQILALNEGPCDC